jgi:hypothetical protein
MLDELASSAGAGKCAAHENIRPSRVALRFNPTKTTSGDTQYMANLTSWGFHSAAWQKKNPKKIGGRYNHALELAAVW